MEQLGIQPTQLLLQIFNFLVLMFLLSKFLYQPVAKMLDERKRKIEEGLKYRELTKQEFDESQKKREEILKKAKEEGRTLIDEAKKEAKLTEADIVRQAQKEAQNILQKAKKDIDLEKIEMRKRMEDETVELASAMVGKILEQVLDERQQRQIIGKKIDIIAKRIQKTSS